MPSPPAAPTPRQAFRKAVRRARAALSRAPLTDAAVHEVRVALKRARAALRLLRPALGERRFRRVDERLRRTARGFARARDSRALLDALRLLQPAAGGGPAPGLRTLAQALDRHHRRACRGLYEHAAAPRRRAQLAGLLDDSRQWPARVARPALRRALEASYRQGRQALAAARDDPRTATLHAWRRQVKRLVNQLELLPATGSPPPGRLPALRALGRTLGDAHDLSLLRRRLRRHPRLLPEAAGRAALLGRLERRRAALRRRALVLGTELYRTPALAGA